MAGSEQEGLDGADADLFVGATWVLTPTGRTDPQAFADGARRASAGLGAEAIAVAPELHDALVAVVSHVPAARGVDADERRQRRERRARGAAAPRRRRVPRHDPHRVEPSRRSGPTSASPTATRSLGALDALPRRAHPGARDRRRRRPRATCSTLLERPASARRNLPVGIPADDQLVELRIPVPDRPGVIAEVTTLAGGFGVNVADLEIAHSLEGRSGVLVLVVAERGLDAFEHGAARARLPRRRGRRSREDPA